MEVPFKSAPVFMGRMPSEIFRQKTFYLNNTEILSDKLFPKKL